MLDHVEVVVTARDVAEGKPRPGGLPARLRAARRRRPAALAAEDSPAGVGAAVAAGVGRVVGVTTHLDARPSSPRPGRTSAPTSGVVDVRQAAWALRACWLSRAWAARRTFGPPVVIL